MISSSIPECSISDENAMIRSSGTASLQSTQYPDRLDTNLLVLFMTLYFSIGLFDGVAYTDMEVWLSILRFAATHFYLA